MVRRSFRRGLRLGLLVGAVAAVLKMLRSFRAAEEPPAHVAPPSTWPPRQPGAAEPAHPVAAPAATPVAEHGPGGDVVEPQRRERPLRATTAPKKAAKKPAPAPERIWVEPSGMVCPPSHPIKAKLSSKLFHLPGMFAYERCKPDRCYATEDGAVADGLTRAKR